MDVLNRVRSVVVRRPWTTTLLVAIVTFGVYALTRRADNPYNQYVLLADAFLDGRLHVTGAPGFLELATFDGRSFVIDPPAPVIFLLPFVAIFGIGADHVLVSCGVGAGAIALWWVAANRLWTDRRFALAMVVLVALGTNFWWAASDGGFWSFAHTSAVFFSAAALVEATGRRRPWLVGLLLGLAGLSRLTVFLLAPLYLFLLLDGDLTRKRENIRRVASFGSALGLAAIAYLAYNRARYGTFTDLGYYHPQYLSEPWFDRGRFDIAYIPRHVHAIFFKPPVFNDDSLLKFRPSSQGLALIFTTPMFLYALRARLEPRSIAALFAAVAVAIPLITHGATGWSQFGYRFSLDLLPALMILTASGMREKIDRPKLVVLALSVAVNLWGVLCFNLLDQVA